MKKPPQTFVREHNQSLNVRCQTMASPQQLTSLPSRSVAYGCLMSSLPGVSVKKGQSLVSPRFT